MNVAIIDLGTNTFNLLICNIQQNSYSIIYNGKTAPKMGKGGIQLGIITPDAFERSIEAIRELLIKINEHNCTKIYAIGTSALRNAKNASSFTNKIEELFKIKIEIISGLQEAEYIFWGNSLAYNWGDSTALILDIGGGSNECIICTNSKILWKHSFENGMQRIISKISPSYPYTEKDKQEISIFLEDSFKLLIEKSKEYSIDILIGSSGPFDTYRDILDFETKEKTIPYYEISHEQINALYNTLINSSLEEISNIPQMDAARIEMLPIASSIINYIITNIHFNQIIQSSYSLKEGVLYTLLNK